MHNASFAAAAVGLGHRVTVIASGKARIVEQTSAGITVYRLPPPVLHRLRRIPVLGRFERALSMIIYSRRAAALIDSLVDKPDLIEAADINGEAFALSRDLPAAIRCHTPTFLLEASGAAAASFRSDARLLIWAERRALRKAHAFSAPSRDLAQRIIDHAGIPADRMSAVPNALDTRLFTPSKFKNAGSPAILWVGRLDPGKGLWVFADAVERLLKVSPDARFILVGGGRKLEDTSNTMDRLQARFADAITAGRVDLRGFVPDVDLPTVYHEADIAVVPSLIYESFSYTCAQAMACGLPVVASALGGIPETLADGECGILIPPNDAAALADAILRLIALPEMRQRMGTAGRARAEEAFAMNAVAGRLIDWYRRWISA